MKRIKLLASLVLALVVTAAPAAALAAPGAPDSAGSAFTVCRTQEAIPVTGYMVNNDNFGGMRECLTGVRNEPAFRVSVSDAKSQSSGSDAFPDIFTGCSWGMCSPHSWLPAKVADLGDPKTTWRSTETAKGTWGAGYDTFYAPRPIHNGQASAEMMIWLNSHNAYNPAGRGWPVVRLDGARWYVLSWETSNGHQHWRYVQFRKWHATTSVTDLPLGPFIGYMHQKGWISPNWYLLNIEAGFEIWNGGTGLATTYFSAQP